LLISRLRESAYFALFKCHNVRTLIIADFIETLAVACLFGYYLKMLMYDIGGAELLGIYSTLSNTLLWFTPMLGGTFSDAFGRKKMILACVLFGVLDLVMLAAIRFHTAKVILALLLQASFIIASPARAALLSESVPPEHVGRAFSLQLFIENISSMVSYMVFGYILSTADVYMAFIASGLLFSTSLILYMYTHETLKRKMTQPNFFSALLKTFIKGIKFVGKRAHLLLLLVYFAFDGFTSSIAAPFTPAFLGETLFLSTMEISMLYTICGIAVIIGVLLIGIVVDKLRKSLILLITKDAFAFPLLLAFALAPPLMAAASMVALAFIEQFSIGVNRYVVEKTESEHRSLVFGLINTVKQITGIPGPLVGILLWKISPRIVFTTPAVTIPVGIIILLMVLRLDKTS